MTTLREKEFDSFVTAIEEVISWNRGVGFEWKGCALMSAEFAEALTRLAFEAPKASRDAFIKSLTA